MCVCVCVGVWSWRGRLTSLNTRFPFSNLHSPDNCNMYGVVKVFFVDEQHNAIQHLPFFMCHSHPQHLHPGVPRGDGLMPRKRWDAGAERGCNEAWKSTIGRA